MVKGFSKLTKNEKRQILLNSTLLKSDDTSVMELSAHSNLQFQNALENFSENVIANYHLPFSVAPNFVINGETFFVPMVTEESSVVAAASSAAGFWAKNGGFHCHVSGTEKVGQIFFEWPGSIDHLQSHKANIETALMKSVEAISVNMVSRGGGVSGMEFKKHHSVSDECFELQVAFETVDSMGANYINSCLETIADTLKELLGNIVPGAYDEADILMSILSNNTPNCVVGCSVEAPVEAFNRFDSKGDGALFVRRFIKAVNIAQADIYRAVTHNKGIFNGVSAVLLATGNDFRAVEAAGHAYAARNGRYASLSQATISGGQFRLTLELPLAIGTVGGLTRLHPMAATALKILGEPNSKTLMAVIASVGLASNFAAIKALITNGIQQGHMKMHLANILGQLSATKEQATEALAFFKDKTVSVMAVRDFINGKK